jgi:hypothetical protein
MVRPLDEDITRVRARLHKVIAKHGFASCNLRTVLAVITKESNG